MEWGDLEKVIFDSSKPDTERIKAAKEIAKAIRGGYYHPSRGMEVFRYYIGMPATELRSVLEFGVFPSKEEEIIARGVYQAIYEETVNRIMSMSLLELATTYLRSKDSFERKVAEDILLSKKDELVKKEVPDVVTAIAKLSLAEAMLKQAEIYESLTPSIPAVNQMPFLSPAQIKSVTKPSKFYAQSAFRAGLWNLEWGMPEEYGVDVLSELRFVDKPKNRDFEVVVRRYLEKR